MRTSMRDVAKKSNVSVATVSHVLNNTRFVTEETRQRVMDAIAELGYSPDSLARSFKTGKRNLIGFIVPDIANPFWATIIEEVENVLSMKGKKLIIVNTKETESREIENIRILASGIVDGLIVASTLTDYHLIQKLVPEKFPMVFLDRIVTNCLCDSIISSDYDAMYKGVETLIQEGHRKIGYIKGLERLSTSQDRFSAYKAAMHSYNLPVDEKFVQQGDSMAKSSVLLLGELLEAECTAIVVSNNVMSDDVLFYFNEHDIKIGRDISLLTYSSGDKVDFSQRRMHLISQPSSEMGKIAGAQILERIDDPSLPIKNIILHSTLIR